MNATALIAEITSVTEFVTQRRAAQRDVNAMLAVHHSQFLKKIRNMRSLDVKDATSVQDTLTHAPWSDEQKNTLMIVVSERLCSVTPGRSHNGTQFSKCDNFEHYLSAKDWAVVDDVAININIKAITVLHRGCKLGFKHLKDNVFQTMTAILAVRGLNELHPTIETLHNIAMMLKRNFALERDRQRCPLQCIDAYPMDPSMLPADVLAHAYDIDDPAVVCTSSSIIRMVATQKFMRITAQGLREPASASACVRPHAMQPHMHAMEDRIEELESRLCAVRPI